MPLLRNSIEINAPAERVFLYASDLAREPEWNPHVLFVERLTPAPVGAGSRFRARWQRSPEMTVIVERYDPPLAWEALATSGRMDICFGGKVAALGPHLSRLTITMDLRPKGVAKVLAPVIARAMQRSEVENLARIKTKIETHQDASATRATA